AQTPRNMMGFKDGTRNIAGTALAASGSPAAGGAPARASGAQPTDTSAAARQAPPGLLQPPPGARTPPASPAPSPSPTPSVTATPDPGKAVREALDALGPHAGRYTLGVEDLSTGTRAVYGKGTGTYDTASIVKVDILAALLLRSQRSGVPLTPGQRQLASSMIRYSDNDATDALWSVLGGPQALDAANDTFGLTRTSAGGWGTWGLTQTTARDQLVLLRAVFGDDSPLSAASRDYIRSLMGSVIPGQDWGVPAASDTGADRVLKNGWLQRSQTKLWDINSIGLVVHDGRLLLVSVLAADLPTREGGIELVERAATTAVRTLVKTSFPAG
ncbi:serine hydrolase, partial [Streptomyces sp. NPDC051940]|uniref:serine hydrolase n=1 Tax=Streptomyces sp. NPDC051940 TaxID=3155675 RepID=UPI00342FD565